MDKNSFMKSWEEVMGTSLTKEDFFIGLLIVAAGLVLLQVGEIVGNMLSSFHWV